MTPTLRPSLDELRRFYAGRDGRRATVVLRSIVGPHLRRQSNMRLLALGYAAPAISGLDPASVERIAIASPDAEGIAPWPPRGTLNRALAVDPDDLPFPGAAFDQAVLCHALEFGNAARLLGELWRVLAPAGELIAIVTNRSGAWTHFERTPFGLGQPYGKNRLAALLCDCGFEPVEWCTALAAPPLRGLRRLDRALTRLLPSLGGVHIVRARKSGGAAAQPIGRVRAVPRAATANAFASPDLRS